VDPNNVTVKPVEDEIEPLQIYYSSNNFTDNVSQEDYFSERQSVGGRLRRNCFMQTCSQVVTGRRLTYQRATRIVQDEEYLTATDNILKKFKRKTTGFVIFYSALF